MNSTLDAWEILQTVVQLGSFASAAEKLHRSQSTISYALSRLQEQLGVRLFELKGRRAQLTEAGRVLLADAEPHLAGFRQIEQRAHSLAAGGTSEIRLSVDSLFPHSRLFSALAVFSQRFTHVHPKLRQSTFLSADSEFSAHNAQICITGLMSHEYFVKPVLEIKMLAVARHDHPLHTLQRQISRSELMRHMLVTIEGTAFHAAPRQPHSAAQHYLSVTTIEAAIEAVRSGLCFAWLPKYRIQQYLKDGEMVPLGMLSGGEREVRLNLVCKDLTSSSRELLALAGLLGINGDLEMV